MSASCFGWVDTDEEGCWQTEAVAALCRGNLSRSRVIMLCFLFGNLALREARSLSGLKGSSGLLQKEHFWRGVGRKAPRADVLGVDLGLGS